MGKVSAELLGDNPYFDGGTFDAPRDHIRLCGQLAAVKQILLDHRWHTLSELADRIGGSQAGISARIRDLRKPKFGSHWIDRQHIGCGLWRYRMR